MPSVYDKPSEYIEKPIAQGKSVASNVIGEMSTMIVSQGLKNQADKLRRTEELEDQTYRKGLIEDQRDYDEKQSALEYSRDQPERDQRSRMNELTISSKEQSLLNSAEDREFNKEQRALKREQGPTKLPEAVKMEVNSLYGQLEELPYDPEDEELMSRRKNIQKKIKIATLPYDKASRDKLSALVAKKREQDAETAKIAKQAELDRRANEVLVTSSPEYEEKMKMYRRYIDSGINVERYQSLEDEMIRRRDNAK